MAQFVVIGVVAGAINAVFALGLVLMYQTTRVLNIGFGALAMVAAFAFSTLATDMSALTAFVLVLAASVAVGIALGLVTLPMLPAHPVVKAVASVGILVALQSFVVLVWGTDPRPIPFLTHAAGIRLFGVAVSLQQLLTIALAALASIGIAALFRLGRLGSALRAVAADVDVAGLVGLPVRRLWVVAWAICTPATALAGVLVLPSTGLAIAPITLVILPALAAALAAQFRYPGRAVLVAIALGIGDGLLASQGNLNAYRGALPLVAVMVALVVIPTVNAGNWERV